MSPSSCSHIIVAMPFATPVTSPFEFTVATAFLSLLKLYSSASSSRYLSRSFVSSPFIVIESVEYLSSTCTVKV